MSISAGVITVGAITQSTVALTATAATSTAPPVTQQWYRSTTSGFSPGGGNIIAGATALTLSDSALIPGTQYYYKLVYTDSTPSVATATQVGALTSQEVPNQNQFEMSQLLGKLDQAYNYNTKVAEISSTQDSAVAVVAGMAVKIVGTAMGGLPKVIACSANSDLIWGFINYNIKDALFIAGMPVEISQSGNVMYLRATSAITRGARVTLDVTTKGGVAMLVGSSGACVVGEALDGASAAGELIRVMIKAPSYEVA